MSITCILFNLLACGTNNGTPKLANKPLYRDSIYDGAADPTLIFNHNTGTWYMFYTNRRAKLVGDDLNDVSWVHGTPIGIAESKDNGASWQYVSDAKIYYGDDSTTFWAPEVIYAKGQYHMYLTIVPGIYKDWSHARKISHFTSDDLLNWKYESDIKLASDKVIDACIFQMSDTLWRMWYNNEEDHKSIYYADSKNLIDWTDKGKIIREGGKPGEGPKVFYWNNQYNMIVDEWKGQGFYTSNDAVYWNRQANRILDIPGNGPEDGVIGQHSDVKVSGDQAFIFYFVHPGRKIAEPSPYDFARSLIQVGKLENADGQITCNRDKPVYIYLKNTN